ncbi:lytic transglycosylase domain-containing protein, partial [Pectobacterium carotovorum]|uniref:lytic transglycosylase domain-containing protein n=1 Tax=Pectobacterium carotovorum TaxID=554 RepID=UPI002FFEB928
MAQMTETQTAYSRYLDAKYGFPTGTMETLVGNESSNDGNAISSKGAKGYAQLMPSAMADAGHKGVDPRSMPFEKQMDIASSHLNRGMEQFGDIGMAIAGYNSGNGRMNAVKNGKASMPDETSNYVRKFTDAGIIPDNSEVIQYAQSTNRIGQKPFQQPDYSEADNAISSVGDTSAWEAKRAQFKNQQTGKPTVSSWEEKRAQFLANKNEAQYPPTIAQSNLNPEMDYLSPEMKAAPEQAVRGLANIPFDIMDAGVGVVNTAKSAGAWAAGQLGMGNGTYHPMPNVYRPIERPTDSYAQLGEAIAPFLIPSIGAGRTAEAIASVAHSPRTERIATQAVGMLSDNLPGTLVASQSNGQIDPSKLAQETALGLAGSIAGRALIQGGAKAINSVRGIGQGTEAGGQHVITHPTRDLTVNQDSSPITPESLNTTAARYGSAAQSGNAGRIAEAVNDIQPKPEIVDAAKQLGLDPDDMLEAYTSGNDAFKAVQMGLASQDESALAAVKRDSINRISERAAKIIDDAGAMPDRLAMDDKFKTSFNAVRNGLKAKEKELFAPINKMITPGSSVDPVSTRNYLDKLADDQGGYQYLSPVERVVYDAISPISDKSGAPTYSRLNAQRSMVGAELDKVGTPFGSTKERNLSALYSMLSKDRDAVAISHGLSDQLKAANAVTAQRKMMEKRVYSLIDKDLSGDVTVKAKNALDGLYSGNTKPFIQLMRAMPDKDMRSQLIATGMRDMLRKGSRSDLAENINGLVDFYGELKRKGTVRLLAKELPIETMRELENFYTLGRNVKSANAFHLGTGKLNGFLRKFDQPGGFVDQLSKHGKMSLIATALGHIPLVGPVLNTSIAAQMGTKAATRKTGGDAVQELMVSHLWKDMVANAKNKPNAATQEKIVNHFEKRLSRLPAWAEFHRTLPAIEKEKIARVGVIGWLSGLTDTRDY